MIEVISDRPIPKAFVQAMQYENEALLEEMQTKLGISSLEARDLLYELKLYLYLCVRYREALPAPIRVDDAWHIFCDRMEEYEAFCKDSFGGVVYHRPHEGLPPKSGVNRTLECAHDLYGKSFAAKWAGPTRCDGVFKTAA